MKISLLVISLSLTLLTKTLFIEAAESKQNKSLNDLAYLGSLKELKTRLKKHPEELNQQDNDGYSPLHLACFFGRYDVVETLIHAGANGKALDNKNETPFQVAKNWGHEEVAYFIEKHELIRKK